MNRTTVLFGPPGTGKTTTLLNEVDAALRSGIHPDRIAFFAFTRKAANEASERAGKLFGLKKDDLPWFRTLHSAAFRMLGLSSAEVMQASHYRELAKTLGRFTFQYSYNEDTERVPRDGAPGDIALSIYSLARSQMTSPLNAWRASGDSDVSRNDIEWFAQTLDNYKHAYQLMDFSDFLDEVHEALPLELLIIDEAQDLTRQQWAFVRRIGSKAKRVIIAGDDDQAIFQWAGADLTTFLSFKGELKVLPTSHRLPQIIWQKAHEISEKIKYRKPKEWAHRPDDKGRISYTTEYADTNLHGSQTWLLLTRLRWQTQFLVDLCRSQGVVYQYDGVWSNQSPEIRAVISYERLRRGDKITGSRATQVVRFIAGMEGVPRQSEITWEDLKWPFEGRPDWMSALSALGAEPRSYIRALRSNGESLTEEGRVVISTIHGAKGGEADNVLLVSDVSKKVLDGINLDPDAEHRVWYVGVSRAKHHLRILVPQTQRHVLI